MKRTLNYLLLFMLLFAGCAEKPLDPDKPVYVKIRTTMGNVTVLLYEDTPLHRDNFIKLCQSDFYKDVLFHRIIRDFVVQGGDPASKTHEPGAVYGDGDGGYTVPAEILPHYFNKRGALIDAKESDVINLDRASAGTQFCFVQGKKYTDDELLDRENRINDIRRNWLYYRFKKELIDEDPLLGDSINAGRLHAFASVKIIDTLAVLGRYTIPEERKEYYKTIGGVPHLDGSVTIFGEVVEGLDIVEKMSQVSTDANNRPTKDVWIKSTKVFQK